MERLIITTMPIRNRTVIVYGWQKDGQMQKLHLEHPHKQSLLGSIHVGVIQKILPHIHGMFIEIEDNVICFHPMNQRDMPIFQPTHGKTAGKAGDRVLVQVTQEALKSKAPQVSFQLSFPGKNLILTTENTTIGVSSKIPEPRKEALKQLLTDMKREAAGLISEKEVPASERVSFGIIVRTNAALASDEELQQEFVQLYRKMCLTIHRGLHAPSHSCIIPAPDFLERTLLNQYWEQTECIVSDSPAVIGRLSTFQKEEWIPQAISLRLYDDKLLPLYKLYRLEQCLDEALKERIWLKSGGFLIIQQTEACVVIDVNSGKNTGSRHSQEAYHKINEEAAIEIFRQMTLRNLYGIILIDFINMKQKEEQDHLLRTMNYLTKKDRVSTKVVDITALGIMEITRKKEEKSLREQYLSVIEGGDYE